jgi:hypothetical protein
MFVTFYTLIITTRIKIVIKGVKYIAKLKVECFVHGALLFLMSKGCLKKPSHLTQYESHKLLLLELDYLNEQGCIIYLVVKFLHSSTFRTLSTNYVCISNIL